MKLSTCGARAFSCSAWSTSLEWPPNGISRETHHYFLIFRRHLKVIFVCSLIINSCDAVAWSDCMLRSTSFNIVTLLLRPSRSKPWAPWTRQLANSLPIWEERSPQPRAMRGKELLCSREFRCWCNATTLSWYIDTLLSAPDCTDDWWSVLNFVLS